MANAEWEKLKEALKKPVSPEAMKEAAERFREYERTERLSGRRSSKPELVSLGYKKTYPHAVELKDIPKELERNPEFYDLMRRIVAKEKS